MITLTLHRDKEIDLSGDPSLLDLIALKRYVDEQIEMKRFFMDEYEDEEEDDYPPGALA